jgi:hypothetical protein
MAAIIRRQNQLEPAGWHTLMDGLSAITTLTSFNGVNFGRLFAGGQIEALLIDQALGRHEAVVAMARLLQRSCDSLTRLDLR